MPNKSMIYISSLGAKFGIGYSEDRSDLQTVQHGLRQCLCEMEEQQILQCVTLVNIFVITENDRMSIKN